MRRIYLLLLFCSSIALQSAYAQPTFTFSPQQVVANQGDLVCVDVTVEDFTDILGVRFSISWDAGVLDYQSITNINPTVTGLDITDFGTNQSGMGIITFDWSNGQPCATATSGVTLPDNVVLFSVCFIASGIYGNHTSIEIADEPLERYVTRLNANCNDIGEFINPGFVSVGTPPLTINVSSADGFTDDVVCIDFNVEDFDDIIAFQYAIKWDSAVLEYQSSTPMNLPLFSSANIGTTQTDSGILNLSWNTTSNSGETLPDGTQILQVCFKIIGACGQNSAVYVSDNPPLPIEVVNSIAGGMGGTNIGLLQNEGNVVVNCFNPNGITLTVGDKNVCPGESFTVDVRVSNFSNISKLQFNLQWNKNVIQMVQPKVSYPQSGGCFFFGSSVNANTPGVVKVDWTSLGPSCSLNDDFILMRLHFKAIGTGGSNSTVSVVNPIYVEQFGPPVENIGINNNNGLVSICQLTGPTIVASSMDANPGDTVCINFSVQDFDEITSMLYTIGWEPNVLQYIGVQGFNLTGLSAANFYEAQALTLGVVGVEWANAGGVSSPDGSSIFTLCFRVVGDPGECATIWFSDIPYPIDIQTTASNNTNVGLNGQPGQVCTLNPLSFVTNLPDVFTSTNSQVCLDVTVENFLQLTNMQYSMNWNPAILQYDTILPAGNLANFNAASYDDNISLTQNGQLIIDWSASNQVLGTSVPDGASIFQICFNVVGNSGDCSVVSISDFPAPINITTATTGDSNLGMTAGQGSACVSASLVLLDQVITGIECPSDQNGAIDITVAGGSGNYLFQWSGPGVIPTAEDQTGLDVGNYFLTVTDAQNPGLVLQDIFTVGYTANVTIADAGGDTTFACGNFFLILNGSGSSSGANISYFWEAVSGGGLVLPGEETKMNPQIIGGSCYQLTVTNSDNGCVATDQICIDAPQVPFVEASAGAAPTLTCTADTVELDGSLSSFGFDIQWTAGPGGSIVPGTENYLTPLVTTSAMYYLTLSAPATGCSATDSVFVAADMQLPVALAGPDTTIGCNDPSVPVDGSSSSVGLQYIYEWSPMGAGEICGDTTSASTTICAPGIYQLVVTDTLNGCTAVDFVEVTGDTLKPSIDAGVDQTLTCAIDAVTLDGVVNTGSGNYTYNWSFTPGGNIQSGQGTLNPVVDGAATYTLEVTDNDNGCQASSEVIVDENKTPPVVAAVTDGPISCADAEAVLDGTGSSTGLSFTQQWFDENGMLLTDSLTATVTTPGMYKFLVTDSSNGCQDSVLVEVEDWTIPPVANAGDDQAKTCVLTEVPLQGTIDTGNPNLVIQWSGPSLNCIQNANSTAPVVTCTGQYIMTVLDTLTGCLHKDTVMVVDDTQAPPADAGADSTLTCAVESLVLNGTSQPSDVTAAWTSIPAGLNITNPSSFNPTVSEPGTYVLTVTSDLNGCSAADLVVIGQDTVAPVADAGVDDFTDCLDTLGSLSAAQSTLTGTSITWTAITGSIDPADIHNVDIEVGPGQYQLTVVSDLNGCEATDLAEIISNAQLPDANAGPDVNLGCNDDQVILTGSGSTGAQITYTWTDANALIIGNGLTVDVTAPGVYTLTIFDGSNNCTNTDEVEVVEVADGEPADAIVDGDPCSDEAMLIGNLPDGATGQWVSPTGANIEFDTAAITLATGLGAGGNTFIWTLSIGHCDSYSSDTASIQVDQASVSAFADLVQMDPALGDTISLDLLGNDHFGSEGVDLSILTTDIFGGSLIATDGDYQFVREKCFSGMVDFDYEICSVGCPEICDTTSARIVVDVSPADEGCDEVPNGITPNGDGLNDELVFDILLNNPASEFPDNEIIIFNRWGDIVYQAKPYLNDWKGTNNSGKDLPQATYYYILRLNIAEGDIIRGDVTLIK